MRLLHYSNKPLGLLEVRQQFQHPDFKPRGLWVSCEGPDDWPTWCRNEEFCPDRLEVVHEVTLRPEAKVLTLDSFDALIDFNDEFKDRGPSISSLHTIRWDKVARLYDGILIAPYQWQARWEHETLWYYTWDCASGCIWNPAAIQSVTVLTTEETA
jgi:hypothetical protein